MLLDTYDTVAGAWNAVAIAEELEANGQRLVGVRLDSGDYAKLSQQVRRVLDDNGLGYVRILVSGGLDEYQLESPGIVRRPG